MTTSERFVVVLIDTNHPFPSSGSKADLSILVVQLQLLALHLIHPKDDGTSHLKSTKWAQVFFNSSKSIGRTRESVGFEAVSKESLEAFETRLEQVFKVSLKLKKSNDPQNNINTSIKPQDDKERENVNLKSSFDASTAYSRTSYLDNVFQKLHQVLSDCSAMDLLKESSGSWKTVSTDSHNSNRPLYYPNTPTEIKLSSEISKNQCPIVEIYFFGAFPRTLKEIVRSTSRGDDQLKSLSKPPLNGNDALVVSKVKVNQLSESLKAYLSPSRATRMILTWIDTRCMFPEYLEPKFEDSKQEEQNSLVIEESIDKKYMYHHFGGWDHLVCDEKTEKTEIEMKDFFQQTGSLLWLPLKQLSILTHTISHDMLIEYLLYYNRGQVSNRIDCKFQLNGATEIDLKAEIVPSPTPHQKPNGIDLKNKSVIKVVYVASSDILVTLETDGSVVFLTSAKNENIKWNLTLQSLWQRRDLLMVDVHSSNTTTPSRMVLLPFSRSVAMLMVVRLNSVNFKLDSQRLEQQAPLNHYTCLSPSILHKKVEVPYCSVIDTCYLEEPSCKSDLANLAREWSLQQEPPHLLSFFRDKPAHVTQEDVNNGSSGHLFVLGDDNRLEIEETLKSYLKVWYDRYLTPLTTIPNATPFFPNMGVVDPQRISKYSSLEASLENLVVTELDKLVAAGSSQDGAWETLLASHIRTHLLVNESVLRRKYLDIYENTLGDVQPSGSIQVQNEKKMKEFRLQMMLHFHVGLLEQQCTTKTLRGQSIKTSKEFEVAQQMRKQIALYLENIRFMMDSLQQPDHFIAYMNLIIRGLFGTKAPRTLMALSKRLELFDSNASLMPTPPVHIRQENPTIKDENVVKALMAVNINDSSSQSDRLTTSTVLASLTESSSSIRDSLPAPSQVSKKRALPTSQEDFESYKPIAKRPRTD